MKVNAMRVESIPVSQANDLALEQAINERSRAGHSFQGMAQVGMTVVMTFVDHTTLLDMHEDVERGIMKAQREQQMEMMAFQERREGMESGTPPEVERAFEHELVRPVRRRSGVIRPSR